MSLKSKAISGFLWSSAGTLGNGIVSFIVTVILARILTPNDFALIALLTVFVSLSNVVVDSGFSQAIIRDDNPDDVDLSSVFFFNLFLSIILYLFLFLLSPYIAHFYDSAELIVLARVVFLVVIFNAFVIIQNATLKRNLCFSTVEKSSVLGSFFAGVIAVILALSGVGVWALVANMVLMPFFRGIILWYFSSWKPKLLFSLQSIKRYFGFGSFLMLQGLLDVFMTNLNTLLIGKVYSKNELGYYSQGGKFDSYIVTPLTSVLDKVVYPIFAKIKNDQSKMKEGYSQMLQLLLFVTLPVMLFFSFYAENTIVFFFGEKWSQSGVYLQLLSILGLFQIIHKVFVNVILIKGKTNVMFFFAIMKQSLRLLALLLTVRISVYAMALGFVLSGIIGSVLYIGLGLHFLNYNFFSLLKDNWKTLAATFFSISLVFVMENMFQDNVQISLSFIVQVIVMVVSYFLFNVVLGNSCIKFVISSLKSIKRRI